MGKVLPFRKKPYNKPWVFTRGDFEIQCDRAFARRVYNVTKRVAFHMLGIVAVLNMLFVGLPIVSGACFAGALLLYIYR